MRKQIFLRMLTLAMTLVFSMGIANAIPNTCDVTLDAQSGGEVTLISVALSPKAKDAETMAVKQAFFALIDRGVEGIQSGQPILSTPSKEFNYTFYKDNKYLNYLTATPLKVDESKIGNNKRVSMKVSINLSKLKADLIAAKLAISPAWQDQKQSSATSSLNPTIMVVPYIPTGEEDSLEGMKAYLDNNPPMKYAVDAVSSQFASHGYKTRDLSTIVANSKTNDIMTEGSQTDAKTMVIQELPADIVATVSLDLFKDGNKGQCTITVNAVERQTAGKLCSTTFSSGQYMTTDYIALTDYALKKIENKFFTQLQDAFAQMVEKGREMKLEFLLGESVTDWDFDTDTPAAEENFKDELEEWLRSNANHGIYDMSQSNDKFIAATINIPLWDAKRDRSNSINNFTSALRKFIKNQLGDAYKAKVSSMGQKLIITIE